MKYDQVDRNGCATAPDTTKSVDMANRGSVELGQLLFDQRDQLAHSLAVEDQPRACGAEQLRKWPGRAQRKRFAIFSDGFAAVAEAVAPNLKGAELSDPVFDVVERAAEEVRLLVPARDSLRIEAGPVHERTLEAPAQLEPFPVARAGVPALLVHVDPLLKGVNRRAVREEQDDTLQQLSSRPACIFLVVVAAAVLPDERSGKQLHGHRCDFRHLRAWMTLEEKRKF